MVAGAAWCVAALAGLLALAYYVSPTSWLDAAALHGFTALSRPKVDTIAATFAHLCNPAPYAVAAVLVIGAAFVLKGLRTAAAVGLLLAGANITSQTLKPLLAYHRELHESEWHLWNIQDAAFPSGHSTAAMALALAVLMIVPRAYRPLTAVLGIAFTLAVSFSILILAWHFPSDVVGGYLVATAWGLVTLAALRYANERWPQEGTMRQAAREAMKAPSPAAIGRVALVLAGIVCLVAASRADQIAGFADRHTAMLAVASAIAVAAAVLLAAVALISSSGGRGNSSSSR
jgi:membrane-associated phospholipid phosphatase